MHTVHPFRKKESSRPTKACMCTSRNPRPRTYRDTDGQGLCAQIHLQSPLRPGQAGDTPDRPQTARHVRKLYVAGWESKMPSGCTTWSILLSSDGCSDGICRSRNAGHARCVAGRLVPGASSRRHRVPRRVTRASPARGNLGVTLTGPGARLRTFSGPRWSGGPEGC